MISLVTILHTKHQPGSTSCHHRSVSLSNATCLLDQTSHHAETTGPPLSSSANHSKTSKTENYYKSSVLKPCQPIHHATGQKQDGLLLNYLRNLFCLTLKTEGTNFKCEKDNRTLWKMSRDLKEKYLLKFVSSLSDWRHLMLKPKALIFNHNSTVRYLINKVNQNIWRDFEWF